MEIEQPCGMPIYLDLTNREMADTFVEGEADVNAWYPSNSAAQKLWRCLECLRDLDDLLEEAIHQKNATKRKRRLKIAITPLHSLITALDDLLNNIRCNKETSKLLKDTQIDQVKKMGEQFGLILPHDHKAPLSVLRNKLSSHIDKKINPSEAKEIGSIVVPSEFGRWLHICLHLALDLTKLDIYWWTCDSLVDGYVRFMSNEPFIVTLKIDGDKLSELAGLHIAKESPRNSISNIVGSLVSNSQWMFKPDQPRIRTLKEDTKENWNTFLGDHALAKNSNY